MELPISGATFNDTNKTITISSGSSSLSSLSDCTISTPSANQLLQYNGSAWVNVSTLNDDTFLIKDDVDGTKKSKIRIIKYNSGTN